MLRRVEHLFDGLGQHADGAGGGLLDQNIAAVRVLKGNPAPPVSSTDTDTYKLAARLLGAGSSDRTVAPYIVMGATDSRYYTEICDEIYRISPFETPVSLLLTTHGTNERLPVSSIKTAVASRADAIGLRSVRFAINSVVPVIGGAISEGLLSIQAYSSLIKSSVGVAGIAAVALVFLPAIIEVAFWRLFLNICSVVSQIFSDRSVTCVLKAFSDSLLVMNVILILSMVTTVISIGILIAARGSA